MMYSVSPELYREAATRLMDAIDSQNYFSGTVAFRFEQTDCRLTTSVLVYRNRIARPEGVGLAITDLVPVWWEFHTTYDEGEVLNDFSFAELKGCL